MEDLAARMRARHGNELLRAIKPHGFVPQGSKVIEIAPGSATEIKNRIRRGTLYRIEECRVILADIVVSRTVPEGPCESIVIGDRRFAEAPDLFRIIPSSGAAHRRRCSRASPDPDRAPSRRRCARRTSASAAARARSGPVRSDPMQGARAV